MEKSKKQIGSGLLLLSTMSFCLLPELLLAFVFQSAKHSLSEYGSVRKTVIEMNNYFTASVRRGW